MNKSDIQKFVPSVGVVVYRREDEYYLQSHEIIRSGDKFTWGPGKPFQREDLHALANSVKAESFSALKLKGLLPDNVLYFQPSVNGSKFIWYQKPQRYHLQFEIPGIKDGDYFMPGTLFAVSDNKLYIFSFKGTDKPDLKTELFHAPFYNTESNGLVCMGTISESRKKKFLEEELDRWSRRFFGGVFTTAHWNDKRLKKGTIKQLLQSVYKKNAFPENLLVAHNNGTLEQFFKKFIDKNIKQEHEED